MRTPFRVCHNCCHLPGCVPLAPETHSHSNVLSGLCSDFHHYTHNNFTPLPGSSHGCLPASCPAHLYLQLLALQLVNAKCTGSMCPAGTNKGLRRTPAGWPSLWPTAFHPFSPRTCYVKSLRRHFPARTSFLEA